VLFRCNSFSARDITWAVTPSAFAELFTAHWPHVCAYVARRTGRTRVEDVASEVFAIAWRRRDELPADPLPWLLRTARNLLLNQRRGDTRREALGLHLGLVATPHTASSADVAVGREEAHAAIAALAQLNENEREVIMLIHWDGLSAVQAARVLGCSHVAARTRLMRARRRLAAALDDPAPVDAPARWLGETS
jgi:RNA polymerase sigma-70 factor, ECF subfamily